MLGAHFARNTMAICTGKTVLSRAFLVKPNIVSQVVVRQATNNTRSSFVRRAARNRSLKEIVMAPAGEGGINSSDILCVIGLF